MRFTNFSPFPALAFQAADQLDQQFHVVVMRATYQLQPSGLLVLAAHQMPLVVADQYLDEAGGGSVKQESDLAPDKPRCDVIVVGTAYAPCGLALAGFLAGILITAPSRPRPIPPRPHGLNQMMKPSAEVLAAWRKEVADVGANPYLPGPTLLDKKIVVTGPRFWKRGLLGGWTSHKTGKNPLAAVAI